MWCVCMCVYVPVFVYVHDISTSLETTGIGSFWNYSYKRY